MKYDIKFRYYFEKGRYTEEYKKVFSLLAEIKKKFGIDFEIYEFDESQKRII
jgi:hypothetical protein